MQGEEELPMQIFEKENLISTRVNRIPRQIHHNILGTLPKIWNISLAKNPVSLYFIFLKKLKDNNNMGVYWNRQLFTIKWHDIFLRIILLGGFNYYLINLKWFAEDIAENKLSILSSDPVQHILYDLLKIIMENLK